MPIIHPSKVVWINRPMTCSDALTKLARSRSAANSSAGPLKGRLTWPKAQQMAADGSWNPAEYTVVVCDRNPWQLVHALWLDAGLNKKGQWRWTPGRDESAAVLDFGKFLKSRKAWKWLADSQTLEAYLGPKPWPESLRIVDVQLEEATLRPELQRLLNLREPADIETLAPPDVPVGADVAAAYAQPEVQQQMASTFASSIAKFGYTNPYA